jgi:membrane-bound ClpP family serine protease
LFGVFFFRFLKRKQLYGKLVLYETLAEDDVDFSYLAQFLGKEGVTRTALGPFDHADIDGTDIEVCSNSKYIPVNQRIKVVDFKEHKLFVAAVE